MGAKMKDHTLVLATYNIRQTLTVALTPAEVDLFNLITMAIEKENGSIHLMVEKKQ